MLKIATPTGSVKIDFGTPADCGLATIYIGGKKVGVVDLNTGQFIPSAG